MTGKRPLSALQRLRELEAQRNGRGDAVDADGPTADGRAGGPSASYEGQPSSHQAPSRRGLGGLLVVALLLLWKFKFIAVFVLGKLKFLLAGLKLLKLGKLFTTGWTMVLSMWVYSTYFGAPFAIGFVLLILVHELGHGLAAKLTGLPVGAPVFIPFFGAMIALKEHPRDTFQDFVIGVGGPAVGSLGGLACLGAARLVEGEWSPLLSVLGYFTLVINLFNLIPVWQLDGARIAAPFRTSMWALAVGILAVVTFTSSGAADHLNPIALFIVLAGAWRLYDSWRSSRSTGADAADAAATGDSALRRLSAAHQRAAATRDVDVTDRQRWIAFTSYVALSALLIILVHSLHAGLPVVAG